MPSLTLRLLVMTAALLIPLQIVVGLVSYCFVLGRDRVLIDDQLKRQLDAVGQIAGVMQANKDTSVLVDSAIISKTRDKKESTSGFQYWGDKNTLQASSANLASMPLDAVPSGFAEITVDGRRWRVLTVLSDGRWIRVAQNSDVRDALASTAALQVFGLLGAGVLILFVALKAGVGRALMSVRNLAEQIAQCAAHGRSGPIGSGEITREFEPIVASINVLLAKSARRSGVG